jgi:hypothetical protein
MVSKASMVGCKNLIDWDLFLNKLIGASFGHRALRWLYSGGKLF